MKTQTVDATEQGDGADGSGVAPTAIDLMARLQTSLAETALKEAVDWATRATPMQVAQRLIDTQRTADRLYRMTVDALCHENEELRAAVKAQPPTLALKTYRERGCFSLAVVSHAALLEERGDKCHVEFARDGNGQIYWIVLSVEDV